MTDVRTLPEWIGSSPDAAVPDRVRLRIWRKFEGRCQCGCGRKIFPGEPWDCEDEIAIINGGERRESNLRPFLSAHHPTKTKADVALKSRIYVRARSHAGIKRKAKGRPLAGTKASGWKRTFYDGWVRR